jgi:hypothetical protein
MNVLKTASALATLCGAALVAGGCLTRPVVSAEPTTKINVNTNVKQAAVDKVDLLFMIDNSSSMGDKQDLLALAVPDLINRLVTPNCVADDLVTVTGQVRPDGTCASGKPEFPPVHDMHIGVVTSSLGGLGSDQCPADGMNPVNKSLNRHNDDQGHLINRVGDAETPQPDFGTANFLSWFPPGDANNGHPNPSTVGSVAVTNAATLVKDFQDVISGVHEFGCGFENQLEAWYRFLIQPDPYNAIIPDPNDAKRRVLDGVDATILQQRADFLRKDSLVAIIMVTDEDDAGIDPLSIGGQGWAYWNSKFPGSTGGGAARPTQVCATNPADPSCTSCAFGTAPNDPGCQLPGDKNASGQPQLGYYPVAEDNLNLREYRMKQRYGVDPQYPISRYVTGLLSLKVPDRNNQKHNSDPKAPDGTLCGLTTGGCYNPTSNCTNPLYALSLPTDPKADLCSLPTGPGGRTPDGGLVFFAAITGVPWQLLIDPATNQFKSTLSRSDWVKLHGNNPEHYDWSGVDPHMWEAIGPNEGPRAGLPKPENGDTTDTADPMSGREWDTQLADQQYACTFPLPKTKDCTLPQYQPACDCTAGKFPPLCDPANHNTQIRGKAYPGIRQLTVVDKLGDNGIVASICPRSLDPNNPDFGYRPAVRAIVDRLKNALAQQCLPQKLLPDPNSSPVPNQVPCLILETLPEPGDESVCNNPAKGLSIPDPVVLQKFRERQAAQFGSGGTSADGGASINLNSFPVCQVTQLVVQPGQTCASDANPGWCYVTGKAAGTCPQAILFSSAGNPPSGARIDLTCIEQAPAPNDNANTGTTTSTPDGG